MAKKSILIGNDSHFSIYKTYLYFFSDIDFIDVDSFNLIFDEKIDMEYEYCIIATPMAYSLIPNLKKILSTMICNLVIFEKMPCLTIKNLNDLDVLTKGKWVVYHHRLFDQKVSFLENESTINISWPCFINKGMDKKYNSLPNVVDFLLNNNLISSTDKFSTKITSNSYIFNYTHLSKYVTAKIYDTKNEIDRIEVNSKYLNKLDFIRCMDNFFKMIKSKEYITENQLIEYNLVNILEELR